MPADRPAPPRTVDLRPLEAPPFDAVVAALGELSSDETVEIVVAFAPVPLDDVLLPGAGPARPNASAPTSGASGSGRRAPRTRATRGDGPGSASAPEPTDFPRPRTPDVTETTLDAD